MSNSNKQYGLGGKAKPISSSLRWVYGVFMVSLAVASCSLITQSIAQYYGFHAALGEPWFVAMNQAWYAPWAFIHWRSQFPDQDGYMLQALDYGYALFLLPQFFILGCWFTSRKPKGNADLHGSAQWAQKEDVQAMGLLDGEGVYVGGFMDKKSQLYLRHNGPEHILCFAPTRSGKGVGLILPTLLSWPGSSLTLDIKGENWALTAGWRKSQGHRVLRFDPTDISGSGASFNPLEELRLDSLYAAQDVQNLAMMLVDPEGKGLSDHWSKAGFGFFSGLIWHCCIMTWENQHRAANLQDLILMMADESRTTEELLQEMLETDHEVLLQKLFSGSTGGAEAHIFIASTAREMLNKDEKEAAGVLSTAASNMSLYRDPIVAMNISKSDFKIHDLMNADVPVDLYLVLSPADIDRVRPLMRLIVDMIVRHVCAKMEFADGASVAGYKHRLLFMLDELTSLGKLPVIEKAIAYIAGYGGKMFLIVQDIIQLNGVYGKDNALMANCHTRIAYAPNTVETAKVLSDLAGKTTVVEKRTSISGLRMGCMKNASVSITETARPLLTPDECMRLPGIRKNFRGKIVPGDMLIFTAGHSPIYGKQILYFQDPIFAARAKIVAPKQSDSLLQSSMKPKESKPVMQAVQAVQSEVASNVTSGVVPTIPSIALEPKHEERSFESYLDD